MRLAVDPGFVRLTVTDNGVGFDPVVQSRMQPGNDQSGGWGLLGMRERAGQLSGQCRIETAPGQGVAVHIVVPLPAAADLALTPITEPGVAP